jgi:hypothetical protein
VSDKTRSVRLLFGPPGVVRITVDCKADDYFVTRDSGTITLEKVDPVSGEFGPPITVNVQGCSCPAWRHALAGAKHCKHFAAVAALRKAGKL